MTKRLLSFLLCLIMIMSLTVPAAAVMPERNTSFEETLALRLKLLGLFSGVSDTNFDLNRAPTRTEAIIMLIRILGKESEAIEHECSHPFKDVPKWADKYIGYAYSNGLTSGLSADKFGASDPANAKMFVTFVLRALGYSDKDGTDFYWNDPFPLARKIGLLPNFVDTEIFWRADVAAICYAALAVPYKDSYDMLGYMLILAGVFTEEQFSFSYDPAIIKDHESQNSETVRQPAGSGKEPKIEQNIPYKANYHGHVYTGGASSKKYHYEANCAGKYSHEISWDEVHRRNLKPCGVCVSK